jgi:protein phosphatase
MGTTIVAVLKDADSTHVVVGHIGDSRAYRYSGGTLTALTRDHTLTEDAVRAGILSADDARHHPHSHILSRAVGPDPHVAPDIVRHQCRQDDRLLLCTDGLTKMLDDHDIAAVLRRAGRDGASAGRELIQAANARGGDDNVTVVVISAD